MEFLGALAIAFVTVFPVELPDKTFVATLVLSTRYPALPTWIGVVAAFAIQCLVAVTAGHFISKLPAKPVQLVAAGLFLVGAFVLARGASKADAEEEEAEQEYAAKIREPKRGLKAAGASFLVLFAAEWGDLSQLATAALVASGNNAIGTGLGAWLALALVSGLAVIGGRWLLRRVRLSLIRYTGAGVCLILAIVTAVSAF